MKFLLISRNGDLLSLMHRVKLEGNDVIVYIAKQRAKPLYDGLLKKCDKWHEHVDGRVVVFDMVGAGKIADRLKGSRQALGVVGAGEFNDTIELDRGKGSQLMLKVGIKIPESVVFSSFEKARSFVAKDGGRWVFKPHGNIDVSATYVASDAEDMREMLAYYERFCQNVA